MNKRLALLGGLFPILMNDAFMGEQKSDLTPAEITGKPKTPPIPKGCKRYFFNEEGFLCEEGEHVVFFDALKASNAVKKCRKWMDNKNK
jgi:hypothetical protein